MIFSATCSNWEISLLLLRNLILCILRNISEESLSHCDQDPDDHVADGDDNDEIKMIEIMSVTMMINMR